MSRFIPGTTISYSDIPNKMFDYFRPMINAAGGLSISQICAITGLEISTIQNWVKRGFVPHPVKKKYHDRHIARILLISSLRNSMKIEQIGELLTIINGNTDDESDDIISETDLYDYFCEACREFTLDIENPEKIVKNVTIDLKCDNEEIHERLNNALLVMVYAHTASIIKSMSEEIFNKLK